MQQGTQRVDDDKAVPGFAGPVVLPSQMGARQIDSKWTDLSGKLSHSQAVGPRDVLLIESEEGLSHPEVVPRRPAIELTEELRKDLEDQGIAREEQQDDLTIMKARYLSQDDIRSVEIAEGSEVGTEMLTKNNAVKKIAIFMQSHEKSEGGGI